MASDKKPIAAHSNSTGLIVSGALYAALFGGLSGAAADPFAEEKRQAIARCQAIDEKSYSTGMIFNPAG